MVDSNFRIVHSGISGNKHDFAWFALCSIIQYYQAHEIYICCIGAKVKMPLKDTRKRIVLT